MLDEILSIKCGLSTTEVYILKLGSRSNQVFL